MDKLLVVDGTNLLCQMFFGMPARIYGKDNVLIHGVIGFIGALIKTIKAVEANKAIVIFDNEYGSGRNEINPDYKANRVDYTDIPEEENPFSQLPLIRQALDFIGIHNAEAALGFEADDVIAGCCMGDWDKNKKIVIMSQDNDFLQLINENVSVYKYRGKKSVLFNVEKVKERFGITPSQIVCYKALAGDNSDNIKGVRGIGPKTAVRLLNDFKSVNGIMDNLSSVKPERIRKVLGESAEQLKRDIGIIKLCGGAVLPFEAETLDCLHNIEELRTIEIMRGCGFM